MQIKDDFIKAALSLPNRRDGDALLGAIARFLRTGAEPTRMRASVKPVWVALLPELKKSRARILAGASTGCTGTVEGREPIPARTRYEVFERDGYTCQYCGAKAPDVELHIDHIVPVSKGGTNDMTNLVTACASCNLGKSDLETTRFSGEDDG